MSRITDTFARRKSEGRAALVVFITAGDPDLATTEALVPALAAAGADVIELGVPFSDPLADGPTIQLADERALRHDVSLTQIVGLVASLRARVTAPLVLMGYYNPILKFGPDAFIAASARAGVDGLIVPDLPPEEGEAFFQTAADSGLDPILLLAPTSTGPRIERAAALSRGFLYYVSLTGVTGARVALAADIGEHVAAIRARTQLPVAVGFGVSTPEQAAEVAGVADGVVVGSALVEHIARGTSPAERVSLAKEFVGALRAALDAAPRRS
ncbi:MAG: tryptophan synthase subunit alpha [Myxococcales bacterium]|nr:tryptophan synthase subunit alpha [Myxococcales bacterium]